MKVKLKFTPDVETGITLTFSPDESPIERSCHLHLRWAKEKCPLCGSAVMMYYAPTSRHKQGMFSLSQQEAHPALLISCVSCDFYTDSVGPSIIKEEGRKPSPE